MKVSIVCFLLKSFGRQIKEKERAKNHFVLIPLHMLKLRTFA